MRRRVAAGLAACWFVSAVSGCQDEGVGERCLPVSVPCASGGTDCGFGAAEAYVERSDRCRAGACIVHKLDNGTEDAIPADPRVVCTGADAPAGCVPQAAIDESIYCTCRCAIANSDRREGLCTCPDDYVCEPIGLSDSYCVKPARVE